MFGIQACLTTFHRGLLIAFGFETVKFFGKHQKSVFGQILNELRTKKQKSH